jgi:opacity protein-like surface antigen
MKKVFALLLFVLPLVLQAQKTPVSSYWGISFHVGPFASGVPSHLEERMKDNGYFPHSGGIFGGGPALPMAKRKHVVQVEIDRVWNQTGTAKLLYSTYSGKLSGISSYAGDLNLNYQVRTLALLGGIFVKKQTFKVTAGPAWHFLQLKADRPFYSSGIQKNNITKLGFAIEAGIRFPAKSTVFIDLNTQYHKVGKIQMSPFQWEEPDPTGQMQITSFEAEKTSFNYLLLNFGVGIRLAKFASK